MTEFQIEFQIQIGFRIQIDFQIQIGFQIQIEFRIQIGFWATKHIEFFMNSVLFRWMLKALSKNIQDGNKKTWDHQELFASKTYF